MSKSQVAVLIPCYNEAKAIATVVSDFHRALPDAKIYVYDNNSTDNSAELAKKAYAGVIVRREPLQGKGNVVRSMFRDISADIYLMVDADNTYFASDAPKLIQAIQDGADMAIGDRLNSTYFSENKRFGHNFGNVLVRKVINSIFSSHIEDVMTGYRAFSRRFVKSFPVMSDGFQIETEMTIHALDKKMHLASIPIQYQDRSADNPSKLNTYGDGMKVLLKIFNMIREFKPLAFFSTLAAVLCLISLILGIPVLIEFFQTGLVERFPTLIVACFILILAALSLFSGFIMDLIAKKHRQLFEINLNILCRGDDAKD